ncbi:prephenate dehydratase [Ekhidna sp.]|uniref:prephenate dehydratase n=1 Tax=Ekhidna sp. TaxID=2608089 RepID=UPI003B5BF971
MKKIAIQGLKGSFHHEAARNYFGSEIELVECEAFHDVVQNVKGADSDFGIMAIENSLAGSIIPNYALLRHPGISICGELTLRVKMNLMALSGRTLLDISEVHSHQMAIRQCSSFLQLNPGLKVVETFDTAGSAADIREKQSQSTAAIASELAAETYGLHILARGIEDNQRSYTRFLILSKHGLEVSDANKASLYLETAHEVGALASVLSIISDKQINLSKLQSHPVPNQKEAYGFFLDLEFTARTKLTELLKNLESVTQVLDCLGIYKQGKTYE